MERDRKRVSLLVVRERERERERGQASYLVCLGVCVWKRDRRRNRKWVASVRAWEDGLVSESARVREREGGRKRWARLKVLKAAPSNGGPVYCHQSWDKVRERPFFSDVQEFAQKICLWRKFFLSWRQEKERRQIRSKRHLWWKKNVGYKLLKQKIQKDVDLTKTDFAWKKSIFSWDETTLKPLWQPGLFILVP